MIFVASFFLASSLGRGTFLNTFSLSTEYMWILFVSKINFVLPEKTWFWFQLYNFYKQKEILSILQKVYPKRLSVAFRGVVNWKWRSIQEWVRNFFKARKNIHKRFCEPLEQKKILKWEVKFKLKYKW